jgi:ATP-dependent Lon protease
VSDEPLALVPEIVPPAGGTPVLPLRDVVVYPHMVIPLFVGREKSIVALDLAMKADKRILLVAQKQADVDDPKADDLYRVGTIATILQLLKLPDGTVKVLVEGVDRASIEKLTEGEFFSAEVTPLPDQERYEEREMDVLTRSVITQFEQYVKLNKKVPPGDSDLPGGHRTGGTPRRHRCGAHVPEAFREAEGPGDPRRA